MDNSLAESIFQAMDIIARKNAEQINYDSTIICTITDISHIEEENYYIVSNDGIEFNAYSENKNYKKGDQVRVSILNNDQTKNKYIVGKYITEESNLVEYAFPTEKVLKVIDYSLNEKKYSLIANQSKDILFYTIDDKTIFYNNFDSFYLEFDVQTSFKEKVKYGNYGVKIDIISSTNKVHTFEFDSNNFFGNTFSFFIPSKQGKIFNILNFEDIAKINCYLYQSNNFFTEKEEYKFSSNNQDIIFSNIHLGLGFNLSILPDNSVKLFSPNSKNFKHYDYLKDNVNLKTIKLLWCNKSDTNNFIGFSDGIGKICQTGDFDDKLIHDLGVSKKQENNKYILNFEAYDEFKYQEKKQDEMELLSQKATNKLDDIGTLELSLCVDKTEKALQKAYKTIENILNYFHQLIGYFKIDEKKEVVVQTKNILTNWQSSIQCSLYGNEANGTLSFKEYYKNIFEKIYNKSFKDFFVDKDNENFLKEQKFTLNRLSSIDWESIEKGSIDEYSKTSFEKKAAKINNFITEFNNIIDNEIIFPQEIRDPNKGETIEFKYKYKNEDKYIDYYSSKEINSYNEADYSLYSNLYSIYWYQYEEGYQDEADLYFKENWKLVEIEDEEGNPKKNIGLPSISEENVNLYSDREIYNFEKTNNENVFSIELNEDKKIEKFKAVVVYNHEAFISDEIEFINEDDFEEEIIGKENMLSIVHGTNSQQNYFLYDSTGFIQSSQETLKNRTLTASYKGEQENLIGAAIYWYLPAGGTMLNSNVDSSFYRGSNETETEPATEICYSKIIRKKDDGKVNERDLEFIYQIKNYCSNTHVKNNIRCKIEINDKKIYEKEISFNFGYFASNGTNYRLVVEPLDQNLIAMYPETGYSFNLKVSLFDYNNNLVQLPYEFDENGKVKITGLSTEFLGYSSYTVDSQNISIIGESAKIPIVITNGFTSPYYGIINIKYDTNITFESEDIQKTISLNTYYSIPWSANRSYSFDGPTQIIYNSFGTNPKYYNKEFSFNGAAGSVTYEIQYLNKNGKNTTPSDYIGLPKLSEKNNIILPSSLYVNNLQYYVSIVCKSGSDVLWYQPILITQNRYESNYLNNWSGDEIRIDNNQNVILSTMMGAGKKNDDNSFSGVLMGLVKDIETGSQIGLYGIHKGAQSFGFKIDGTAFIGKSEGGRIEFDGTKGIIESAGFSNTGEKKGMQINLEEGKIEMYGQGIIQSNNMEIDLTNGKISSNRFSLNAKTSPRDTPYRFIHEDMFNQANESTLIGKGWITSKVFFKEEFYNLMSQASLGLSVKLWDITKTETLKTYLRNKKAIPKKIYYEFKNSTEFYIDETEKEKVINDIIKFISNVPLNISLQDYENRNKNIEIISGLSKFFDVDKDGDYSASDARLMMRQSTDLTNKYLKLEINNTSGFKVSIVDGEDKIYTPIFNVNYGGVTMSQATIIAADLITGTIEKANIEEVTIKEATISEATFDGPLEGAIFKNVVFDRIHYGSLDPDKAIVTKTDGAIYFQLVSE